MRSGSRSSDVVDQIIGLILAILGLAYLAYALLRPEKF
ncbi:MAG TPA: K(+)-transporting ATPase subunit F [Candidatus Acidoferrales bacterium]|nr:K(+)-transporting ATPase subunit F [Candidatus Acidoferrales bacterium]